LDSIRWHKRRWRWLCSAPWGTFPVFWLQFILIGRLRLSLGRHGRLLLSSSHHVTVVLNHVLKQYFCVISYFSLHFQLKHALINSWTYDSQLLRIVCHVCIFSYFVKSFILKLQYLNPCYMVKLSSVSWWISKNFLTQVYLNIISKY